MKMLMLLPLMFSFSVEARRPEKIIPSVSITSPVNGSSVNVNSKLTLSANASNAVKVRFLANNLMVCDDASAPFSCSYTAPASAQSVSIKAVAYSSSGQTAQNSVSIQVKAQSVSWVKCADEGGTCNFSGTATVRYGANTSFVEKSLAGPVNCSNAVFGDPIQNVVKACYLSSTVPQIPQAPSVSISSPSNGSSANTGSQLSLIASASNVVKVSFYANGALVCEKTAAPYSCSYTAPSSPQMVAIKAMGTSASGQSAEASISLNIVNPPVVIIPPSNTTGYPVYSGCNAPPATYSRKIVLDAATMTLQQAIDTNFVKRGDEVVLKGNHGSLYMSYYGWQNWVNNADWIKIDGKDAVMSGIELRDVNKFHFTNMNVNGSVKFSSNGSDFILSDSFIYGALDSSNFDVNQWFAMPAGLLTDSVTCVSAVRNRLLNLSMGIQIFTRGTDVESVKIKALVLDNELRNITGDFLRPLGSEIIMKGNRAYDGYLSDADGDGNHDDFIQGFALGGIPFDNVQIIDNYFQETTNPNRKFNAGYQGITVFDGVYSNYVVRNNTIIGSAYHGISAYGVQNAIIENNTVLSNFPNFGRDFWIYAPGSSGTIVRNNFANAIVETPTVTFMNNAAVSSPNVSQHLVKFDVPNASYDLRIRSDSPYYNKNIGDPTPNP